MIELIIEKRLERVATEKKGKKIEADLDGRHATRKSVLVDEIKIDSKVSKSKEDEYVFYHNNSYVNNYTSLDAKVTKENDRDILYITPNDKSPNDEG